jgi:hypothetical protein
MGEGEPGKIRIGECRLPEISVEDIIWKSKHYLEVDFSTIVVEPGVTLSLLVDREMKAPSRDEIYRKLVQLESMACAGAKHGIFISPYTIPRRVGRYTEKIVIPTANMGLVAYKVNEHGFFRCNVVYLCKTEQGKWAIMFDYLESHVQDFIDTVLYGEMDPRWIRWIIGNIRGRMDLPSDLQNLCFVESE